MDAQVIYGAIGVVLATGTAIVGVALFAGKSRDVAESALHKARGVEGALSIHITADDRAYVRKETLEPQLKALTDAVGRIEDRQTRIFERLMGSGV